MAEVVAWCENGNHATIYATGNSSDGAYANLNGVLCELKLIPEASMKGS